MSFDSKPGFQPIQCLACRAFEFERHQDNNMDARRQYWDAEVAKADTETFTFDVKFDLDQDLGLEWKVPVEDATKALIKAAEEGKNLSPCYFGWGWWWRWWRRVQQRSCFRTDFEDNHLETRKTGRRRSHPRWW